MQSYSALALQNSKMTVVLMQHDSLALDKHTHNHQQSWSKLQSTNPTRKCSNMNTISSTTNGGAGLEHMILE